MVSFSRVVTKKWNTLETYFRYCTPPSKYPFSCNATHPLVDAEGLHTLPEKVRAIVETLALQNSSPCWDCFPTTLGSYPTWLQCWPIVSVTDRGRKSSGAGLGSRKVLLIGPRSSWCHCKCWLILTQMSRFAWLVMLRNTELVWFCRTSIWMARRSQWHSCNAHWTRQKKYSQIEKEALACVVGVCGRHVWSARHGFTSIYMVTTSSCKRTTSPSWPWHKLIFTRQN